MKRARDDPVHRFLDIEATVGENDHDEDDEDEENNDDGFIDDEPAINRDPRYTPWRQMDKPSNPEGGWHDLVTSLAERYASGSKTTQHFVEDNCSRERPPLDPALVSCIENMPAHNGYPFWRVRCNAGTAQAVVLFLREMAAPRHEMLSAFTNDSTTCWVYLEASMNLHLHHLLYLAPGIIRNQSGLISHHIDSSEGLRLLKMQNASASPVEIGKWAQVRKGIYKGDVGHIMSTESRAVQLLLVPRLSQPQAPKEDHSHSRPASTLFDFETVKRLYNTKPVLIQEHIYSFRGDRFEHGLIIKSYTSDLISTTVSCMPLNLLCLFLESCHPSLMASQSSFLKPSEWHFAEGDEACIVDNSYPPPCKSGVVSRLRSDAVELSTEGGNVSVPWLKIRKVIHQGDFVEVTGGMYLGWTGWVSELHEQVGSMGDAQIRGQFARVVKIEDNKKPLSDRVQMFDVSVNLLKQATVPHVLGTHPQDEGAIVRSERIPWINTEIFVVAHGNPYRTMRGIVTDVICNQPTPSGLTVVVQMNSMLQFPCVLFDYDGVVEASHGVKLHDYVAPKSDLFMPRNLISEPSNLKYSHAAALIQQPSVYPDNSPGYATPIPESLGPLPSSPAWDPSSRTPHSNSDDTESLPSPNTSDQEHALLDLRLLDAQLRVSVTGGKFNKRELTASVQSVDGRLCIRHQFYKTTETLLPEWVTPKYPNATRDNGLLVVIKGDHCGKFVRRIHHRYEAKEAIVVLGVVTRVAGHMDSLSGKTLELDVSHLCVCEDRDKGLNISLMNSLREEARRIRVK